MRIPRMMAPALVLVALLGVAAGVFGAGLGGGRPSRSHPLRHSAPFPPPLAELLPGPDDDQLHQREGGCSQYKIVQVDGDSQSKADWPSTRPSAAQRREGDILAGVLQQRPRVPIAERWQAEEVPLDHQAIADRC